MITISDGKSMNQNIIDGICQIVGKENLQLEEMLKSHTTFQIGGPAECFVTPHTVEELTQLVKLCKEKGIPYFVLGNGSNLLVSDMGMDGIVIQLYRNFSELTIEDNIVKAQAGAMLAVIGNAARNESLTGFEFASGIPGTLGGAVVMNAGAYGGEMKDIIKSVQLMDGEGNVFELACDEMDFGYRHSIVEEKGYIVLGAVLELARGEQESITARMKELSDARREKQPLEFPSAGSTFKRPEGYFAGKLIMDANLRGYRVGGAQVSEKHCGFVVNRGGATATDVLELIRDVEDRVYEMFHVKLEPEIKLVGKQ